MFGETGDLNCVVEAPHTATAAIGVLFGKTQERIGGGGRLRGQGVSVYLPSSSHDKI